MRSGCYCNVMVFAELAFPQILKRIIYSNNEYAQDSFEFILVIRICPISEHTLSKYSLNLFLIPPEGKVTQTCHIDITGFHETIPKNHEVGQIFMRFFMRFLCIPEVGILLYRHTIVTRYPFILHKLSISRLNFNFDQVLFEI